VQENALLVVVVGTLGSVKKILAGFGHLAEKKPHLFLGTKEIANLRLNCIACLLIYSEQQQLPSERKGALTIKLMMI